MWACTHNAYTHTSHTHTHTLTQSRHTHLTHALLRTHFCGTWSKQRQGQGWHLCQTWSGTRSCAATQVWPGARAELTLRVLLLWSVGPRHASSSSRLSWCVLPSGQSPKVNRSNRRMRSWVATCAQAAMEGWPLDSCPKRYHSINFVCLKGARIPGQALPPMHICLVEGLHGCMRTVPLLHQALKLMGSLPLHRVRLGHLPRLVPNTNTAHNCTSRKRCPHPHLHQAGTSRPARRPPLHINANHRRCRAQHVCSSSQALPTSAQRVTRGTQPEGHPEHAGICIRGL